MYHDPYFEIGSLCIIGIPLEEKITEFNAAINTINPILKDAWATMDGLKLHLQKSLNESIQEMFYNDWKEDHCVTNVFVFVPDGTIPIAFFNVPGCVHDSQVAKWGEYMKNWNQSTNPRVGFVLLILHLEKSPNNNSSNHLKII